MQNRFGLKDFVLLILVIGLGVMMILSMIQEDRRFERMSAVQTDLQDVREQLARVQSKVDESRFDLQARLNESTERIDDIASRLDRGVVVSEGAASNPGGSGETRPSPSGGASETSWARPGVEITYPEPYRWPHDPRQDPAYATGGTFIEIFETKWPSITPFLYSDVYGRRIVDQVVEALADYDPETLRLKGVLAEAWQYDPDGMWLRVRINKRARFSDGKPVTAEDVRWSFADFIFNMEIQAERFRSVYNPIHEVRVIDDRTVEFTFEEAMFLNLDVAMRMPIVPKHFYSRFTPSQLNQATGLLMGSGPYRLRSLDPENQWKPPSDVTLVRNEQYWRDMPAIQELRYKSISDNLARLKAFEDGEGDMMRGVPEQWESRANDPRFLEKNYAKQWTNMRSGYSFIAWNCGERNGKDTPFIDKRVRLAMTRLMDRERIVRDFYKGLGQVCTGPFSPKTNQSDPTVEPWTMDLEESARLLTEAGWIDRDGNGFRENERGDEFVFQFTYSTGSSTAPLIAKYLTAQAAKVGVKCEENIVEWAIYQQLLDNRDFDAITMAWAPSDPENDPYQLWHSSSIQNQGDNFAQWASPEADRLIEEARRELDYDKRMDLWHQLHRHIHDEQPYTFLVNPPWIRFISKRIHNVYPYPRDLEKNEMFIPAPLQ
ncbi:MAG: hypothetical protein KDA21_04650 [Phycisphaerales bacterium]|nr:hypothetical protein [Phycisphaerales bacterium]